MRASPRPILLLALALVATGVAAGCGGEDEVRSHNVDIEGEWRGRLEQQGMKPFEVQATIRSFRQSAHNPVQYTGIECSGNWTFLSQGVKDYRFREVIDRGAGGTCKGVGTVRLIPDGDFLDYRFRGGGVESHGVLSRVSD